MTQHAARTIPATEFEADCLAIIDDVAATGAAVTITKRGVPVAKLVQAVENAEPIFGRLAGWIMHERDLISPIDEE